MYNPDVIYAMTHCAPSHECIRCKENLWNFISLSPNKKSATYRCDYCNRKEIRIARVEEEEKEIELNVDAVLAMQVLGVSKEEAK